MNDTSSIGVSLDVSINGLHQAEKTSEIAETKNSQMHHYKLEW